MVMTLSTSAWIGLRRWHTSSRRPLPLRRKVQRNYTTDMSGSTTGCRPTLCLTGALSSSPGSQSSCWRGSGFKATALRPSILSRTGRQNGPTRPWNSTYGFIAAITKMIGHSSCPLRSSSTTMPRMPPPGCRPSLLTTGTTPVVP